MKSGHRVGWRHLRTRTKGFARHSSFSPKSIAMFSSAALLSHSSPQVNHGSRWILIAPPKNDLSFSLFLSKIWPTMAAVNGRGLRVTSCFALHRFKAGNGLSVRRGCPSMFLCSSRLDEDWTRLLSTCQIFFGGPKSRENACETNVCGREWSVDKKENVKNCVPSFLIIGYVILQIHYFIFRRKSQVTK